MRISLTSIRLAFSCFLFLLSCNKSETEDPNTDFGYEYYPLEVGKYREYVVDSIIYRPVAGGTAIDSSKTFVREEIVDMLRDNSGMTLFVLEYFERKSAGLPWEIKHVWTLSRNGQQAFRTEGNLRFIKMVFPLKKGRRWDGNVFIDESMRILVGDEGITMFNRGDYRVSEVGQAFHLGNFDFLEAAVMSLTENENKFELRRAEEKYARGIGLVYRELKILDTQCVTCCAGVIAVCDTLPWEVKAEKGFILRQALISHN